MQFKLMNEVKNIVSKFIGINAVFIIFWLSYSYQHQLWGKGLEWTNWYQMQKVQALELMEKYV